MNSKRPTLAIACSMIAMSGVIGQAALAQTAEDPVSEAAQPSQSSNVRSAKKAPSDKSDASDADIIVTGTSISGVSPVGTEAVVISRQDAEKTGFTTPAEVLRTIPQIRVGEYDREGGASTISIQNSAGSNSVSLRGLSSTSSTTLILVDGRRTVGTGASYTSIDANQVPLAALQRLEVVADGASAIYGSDAIGGVINYILRKDYKGAEISVRGSTSGGGFERGLSGTGGLSWKAGGLGQGNVLVTYDYAHRDPYRAGKNPYLRYDLTPLGGPDRRLNGGAASIGFVPSIVVTPDASSNPTPNTTLPRAQTSVYYGVPAGAGVGLAAGDLLLNQPALSDLSYFSDYIGKQDRHQLAVFLNQELGNSMELFVQGRYTNRETITRTTESLGSGSASRNVTLPSVLFNTANQPTNVPNPFYIHNIPGTAAAPLTVVYPSLKDFGTRTYRGSDESINVTAGLKAKLPGNWEGEGSYTIGRNQGCTYCLIDSYINPDAFQYQINIGAINPLSSQKLSADILGRVSGTQKQIGHNGIDDMTVKFSGPLFKLPGGTVRAAIGGERNKIFNYNENTSFTGINNDATVLTDRENSYYSRSITSAFAELYIPVVSDDMKIPLVKKLVLSSAVRYDKYSDAGKSTNPKFGFSWDVSKFLSFGGTWGTSFRGPSITDTNPSAYVSGFITPYPVNFNNQDPRIDNLFCFGPGLCYTNAAILFGSNPDLKPETATNWSLNAQFKPGAGFKASVNYYNIHFNDRLVFPATIAAFPLGPDAGSNPPTYSGYENFIIPINNPSTCLNTDINSADPVLQNLIKTPIYNAGSGVGQLGGLANFCDVKVVLDSRFTNLAQTFTDGLDLSASWDGLIGEVAVNVSATANMILNFKQRVTDSSQEQNYLGLLNGGVVKWRGRANVGVSWKGANATLFGNYVGSFINNVARSPLNAVMPDQKIPSYTTFDLNLGYATNFEKRRSPLSSLRYSLTIQNLFNDYPPLVYQSDKVVADVHGVPFGRTVAFQITGAF